MLSGSVPRTGNRKRDRMGNPGKDAGLGFAVRQYRRAGFLFAAILAALAGCAVGPPAVCLPEDFVGPPSTSLAEHQTQADTGSEKPAQPKQEPAEALSKPEPYKPRTLPQALCDYLRRLHLPKPLAENEMKNGAEPSSGEEKEAASENKSNGQKGEKSPPATGQQKPDREGSKENQQEPESKNDSKEKEEKAKEEKDKEKNGKKDEAQPSWFSAHAQATMDTQAHSNFSPPYTGPHSLLPNEPAATSVTATLFLDARLWECCGYTGELVFNPELAGGRGLSNV